MSRITEALIAAKRRKGGGFIPFVTAGDPSPEISLDILLALAELGADVIELGVPFSDPIADGPTIQRSSERALRAGMSLTGVIEIARQFRAGSRVPLILFSYLNPIIRMGVDEFGRSAAKAGIDGLLVTDVIDREARAMALEIGGHGIELISLIAPTTSGERLASICREAQGFVYAVSRAGVTGARGERISAAEALVSDARKHTDLPIAVGFGISTPSQIQDVLEYADAAIVGSAIVQVIEQAPATSTLVSDVQRFVSGLVGAFAKAPAGT